MKLLKKMQELIIINEEARNIEVEHVLVICVKRDVPEGVSNIMQFSTLQADDQKNLMAHCLAGMLAGDYHEGDIKHPETRQ